MIIFQYHPAILERFPRLIGGAISIEGATVGASPETLQAAFRNEQQATLQRLGDTPLSQIEALSAWREAFHQFGVKPTQYRSASEALLRRLTKHGDIPSINAAVDLANLVSIRYALPVAAFDLHAVSGSIVVKFAQGDERFTPLGGEQVQHPEPGEVIFVDEAGLVFARRWCWRQSAQSASDPESTRILLTIESHHAGGEDDVRAGMADLKGLIGEYLGGDLSSDVLKEGHPQFETR